MQNSSVSCRGSLTRIANQTFTLDDLRIMALDAGLFAPCSDYAKRFFPRTSLARAA